MRSELTGILLLHGVPRATFDLDILIEATPHNAKGYLVGGDDEIQVLMQTFPCPNCNEFIDDTSETCRFCSAPVDRQAAVAAGELQSRVNQACSDASFLRIAAVTMWIFLGLHAIPILPVVGLGSVITIVVVIVLIFRWMVKFGGLQTNDPDYRQAKRSAILAVVLWLSAIPVRFILLPIIHRAILS